MTKIREKKPEQVNSYETISDYSFYLQLIVEEKELDCEVR
jgi:hypothetical protein